jgi:HAE1 family hydrophobic/amphiphilic exporter-1
VWLTRFAITRPVITAMVFIGLAVYGVMSYFSLGVSLFPNVAFPFVAVSASYPGASPAEMEKLVIKPIEDQLNGMENMELMRGIAQEGVATVVARFKLDTDLNYETIDVQRRVDVARVYMPSDLTPPTVSKFSTATEPILDIAVSSQKLSLPALSDLIADSIIPDLKAVPGVLDVDTSGDAAREIHVYPNTPRLRAVGATLGDINNALNYNNANLPGGRMDAATRETTVSVHADIIQPPDILRIPLTVPAGVPSVASGTPSATVPFLKIGDIATVDDGHVEMRRPSYYNGAPSVILEVQRQNTADEVKTTDATRAAMQQIRKRYPDVTFKEMIASADFTRASINGVLQSLGEGILLTAVVMLLFLHAWRNAVVVLISIPTSLLATFVVMNLMGFTVDLISMMGLGLTIGILVDDSIVVLENITRHRDLGASALDAAYIGRTEIGKAAITITLVDVVVFLPIAFLSGIVGKYMHEFGVVIVVATLFSLFVSFTLTPLLAGRWSIKRRTVAVPAWARWFQVGTDRLGAWYANVALPWALSHRLFVPYACAVLVLDSLTLTFNPWFALRFNLAITLAVLILWGACWLLGTRGLGWFADAASRWRSWAFTAATTAIVCLFFLPWPKIGSEFIPTTDDGVLRGTITYHIGTPLATTAVGMARLEKQLMKIDGVESVLTRVGVKPSGVGSVIGGHVGRFTVFLAQNRRKETNRALADARQLNWTVPGATYEVASEGGNPLTYTLTGPDAQLEAGANKLVAYIKTLRGPVNVQSAAETEGPRLNIQIDPRRAALLDVQPADAALAARIAIGGVVSTRVRLASGLTDVRLELPYEERNRLQVIEQLTIRSASGMLVPLDQIADFSETIAPTKIERLNRERIVRVSADIDPTQHVSYGDLVAPIQKELAIPGFLPNGVRYIAEDTTDLFNQTIIGMAIALVTSFVLVYTLMVVLYGGFVEPFVVMFSVPVAIVGALVALTIRGQTFNLFSMIAIIMLYGLVSKNGILLVDYANQQRAKGLDVFAAMREAARVRFRPILMTTCAMIFGMLPLSLGLTEGAESRASMGTVLIGGLMSSLILTLVLVPVMYTWIIAGVEGRQRRKAARRAVEEEHNLEPGEALPAH